MAREDRIRKERSIFHLLERPGNMEELLIKWRGCERCELHRTRKNICIGNGSENARVLVVAEAPGRAEDESGNVFVGREGLLSKKWMAAYVPDEDTYWTNLLGCMPRRLVTGALIMEEHVRACSKRVDDLVDVIRPRLVVLLGARALQGSMEKSVSVSTFSARTHVYYGANVVATIHPSALSKDNDYRYKRLIQEGLKEDFERLGAVYRGVLREGSP